MARTPSKIRELANRFNLLSVTPDDVRENVVKALKRWGRYFKHSVAKTRSPRHGNMLPYPLVGHTGGGITRSVQENTGV